MSDCVTAALRFCLLFAYANCCLLFAYANCRLCRAVQILITTSCSTYVKLFERGLNESFIASVLLVFSVTLFKIDQNKKSKPFNRLCPEPGNRKKIYIQSLSKIRVTTTFLMEDMRRNVFPKFIEICMETPCWCPPTWAPTWRPETSRNICH